MRRTATKDDYEKETEEVERLVRPSPKVKPPRRDRRRERVKEKDPDLDTSDKDLSLNYKTIGGSFGRQSIEFASEAQRDTYLEQHPGADPSKHTVTEPEPTGTPSDGPALAQRGVALHELARDNVPLKVMYKQLLQPKSDLGGLAEGNPDLPASVILKGVSLPEGVKTLGDVVKALRAAPPLPKKKKTDSGPPSAPTESAQPTELAPANAPAEDPSKAPAQDASVDSETPADEEGGSPAPDSGETTWQRREPTAKEGYEAKRALWALKLPRKLTEKYREMHPDDIRALMATYEDAAKLPPPKDLASFAKETGSFFATDPDKVPPPNVVFREGKAIPFASLTGDDRAAALRSHQVQVVARSLAMSRQMQRRLRTQGIPSKIAKDMVRHALDRRSESEKIVEAQSEAQTTFADSLRASTSYSDKEVQRTMHAMQGDIAGQIRAAARFQASDYMAAREQFLSAGPNRISEHQKPSEIVSSLRKASAMLLRAQRRYPAEVRADLPDIDQMFRDRVTAHLRALSPEKFHAIKGALAQMDMESYKRRVIMFTLAEKARQRAYEKAKRAYEKAQQEAEAVGSPYRDSSPEQYQEIEAKRAKAKAMTPPVFVAPSKPTKPAGYDAYEESQLSAKDLRARRADRARAHDQFLQSLQPIAKTAYSSYSAQMSMGRPLTNYRKEAVYWGVDPYADPMAPRKSRPKPDAFTQFGFPVSLTTEILSAAKDWLRQPTLARQVDGMAADARYRAALDLAISQVRADGIDAGLHPAVYTQLLSRLMGSTYKSAKGSKSPYAHSSTDSVITARGNVMSMPKFAKSQANEILATMDKMASDIQANHQQWGMPFETAKSIVNTIDKLADQVEVAAFGKESFERRQAEVIQSQPDEPYMASFDAPSRPIKTDADEPYMSSFEDDQTSGLQHGKTTKGQPLVK